MNRDFRPKKRKEIQERKSDIEAILYNPETEAIHIVNMTAYKIWKLSNGKNTINDIENKLKKIYQVPDDSSLVEDIKTTVIKLKNQGLIS
jgi:hypothetical protein